MSEKNKNHPADQRAQADQPDQDLERQILRGRRFGLAEAIGRAAGGSLKGASPIPDRRQALLDMGALLESRLVDPEGSLRAVIQRELAQSPDLRDTRPDTATADLIRWTRAVLETPWRLEELVRQADVRWGRDYTEKPHFNRPGSRPDPEDPYTPDSVREALRGLLRQLDGPSE